jgi:hypothetical protein
MVQYISNRIQQWPSHMCLLLFRLCGGGDGNDYCSSYMLILMERLLAGDTKQPENSSVVP